MCWSNPGGLYAFKSGFEPNGLGLQVSEGLYRVNGQEIVGGYLLLKATDFDEAVSLMQTCPAFDSDGFVEIREMQ